jgi:hypothetical protein
MWRRRHLACKVISSEEFSIVLECDWHENTCDVYDGDDDKCDVSDGDDGTVLLCSVFQASFDKINVTSNGKSYVFGGVQASLSLRFCFIVTEVNCDRSKL